MVWLGLVLGVVGGSAGVVETGGDPVRMPGVSVTEAVVVAVAAVLGQWLVSQQSTRIS